MPNSDTHPDTDLAAELTRIKLGSCTDRGKERSRNEDSLLWYDPGQGNGQRAHKGILCVVADGMGGLAAGEVASKLAVERIVEHFAQDDGEAPVALRRAIEHANAAICDHSQAAGKVEMGSTVVCALIKDDELYVAHVGDSRAYLLREDTLAALTADHSLVGEQVRQGLISSEEAERSPYRNIITRALGLWLKVDVDVNGPIKLRDGDDVLLCSDGVNGIVSADQIRYVLQTHHGEPQTAADMLIEAANAAGGFDNATAIVMHVEHVAPPRMKQPDQPDMTAKSAARRDEDEAQLDVVSPSPVDRSRGLHRRRWAVGAVGMATLLALLLIAGQVLPSARFTRQPPDSSAVAAQSGVSGWVISVQPQPPLIALSDLSPAVFEAGGARPNAATALTTTASITVILRTNATLVEPLPQQIELKAGREEARLRLELVPQADYNPPEQVKIEVLAEGAPNGAGGTDTWTLGAMGLPANPSLRAGVKLNMIMTVRLTPPGTMNAASPALAVRWVSTGKIPGDLRPDIAVQQVR